MIFPPLIALKWLYIPPLKQSWKGQELHCHASKKTKSYNKHQNMYHHWTLLNLRYLLQRTTKKKAQCTATRVVVFGSPVFPSDFHQPTLWDNIATLSQRAFTILQLMLLPKKQQKLLEQHPTAEIPCVAKLQVCIDFDRLGLSLFVRSSWQPKAWLSLHLNLLLSVDHQFINRDQETTTSTSSSLLVTIEKIT